ncbi:MAG: hypothetical protein K2W92_00170 [Alphaproteobacteria bacterium]|nr:hypothetical protein [Alphaproteobacteria bacterium]
MTLSRQSAEILLDLLEIKVGALQIQDRDDARELNKLRKCRQELLSARNQITPKHKEKLEEPAPFQQRTYRKTSNSTY